MPAQSAPKLARPAPAPAATPAPPLQPYGREQLPAEGEPRLARQRTAVQDEPAPVPPPRTRSVLSAPLPDAAELHGSQPARAELQAPAAPTADKAPPSVRAAAPTGDSAAPSGRPAAASAGRAAPSARPATRSTPAGPAAPAPATIIARLATRSTPARPAASAPAAPLPSDEPGNPAAVPALHAGPRLRSHQPTGAPERLGCMQPCDGKVSAAESTRPASPTHMRTAGTGATAGTCAQADGAHALPGIRMVRLFWLWLNM